MLRDDEFYDVQSDDYELHNLCKFLLRFVTMFAARWDCWEGWRDIWIENLNVIRRHEENLWVSTTADFHKLDTCFRATTRVHVPTLLPKIEPKCLIRPYIRSSIRWRRKFFIYIFSSPSTKSVDDDDDLMKSPEKALKLYEAQQSRWVVGRCYGACQPFTILIDTHQISFLVGTVDTPFTYSAGWRRAKQEEKRLEELISFLSARWRASCCH